METVLIKVDDKYLGLVEVPQFQRKLDAARVNAMAQVFSNGVICPPICLAKIAGEGLAVIDGQHRYEAWKKGGFPLSAIVARMTRKQAVDNFIALNSNGVRVPLGHRLMVSTDGASRTIRNIAKRTGANILMAYRACLGASGQTWLRVGAPVDGKTAKLAETVLGAILLARTPADYFLFKGGTVQALAGLVRGRDFDAGKIVNWLVKNVNWSKSGPISKRYGTSCTSQKSMRDYLIKAAWKMRGA